MDAQPQKKPDNSWFIVPLTEYDINEATRLYTRVFLEDEPTTHRHAPDPVLFLYHARYYVELLVAMALSFIARDKNTGDCIGFIFCHDMTDELAEHGEHIQELVAFFQDAVIMIQELEDRYLDLAGIVPGTTLHVFQLGVSKEFRGCGIARALIEKAVIHAGNHGYRQVVADCTGLASKRVSEQCGFRELGFLSYETFTRDEKQFFAGLPGGISLMMHEI